MDRFTEIPYIERYEFMRDSWKKINVVNPLNNNPPIFPLHAQATQINEEEIIIFGGSFKDRSKRESTFVYRPNDFFYQGENEREFDRNSQIIIEKISEMGLSGNCFSAPLIDCGIMFVVLQDAAQTDAERDFRRLAAFNGKIWKSIDV